MKCIYCGKDLTEQEIQMMAEAEEMTVPEFMQKYSDPAKAKQADIMCDDCANG